MEKTPLDPCPDPRVTNKTYCKIFDPLTLAASLKATQSGTQTLPSQLPSPSVPLQHCSKGQCGNDGKKISIQKKIKGFPEETHFHWKVILAEKTGNSARSDIWVVSEMVSILFTLPHCAAAAGTLRGKRTNEMKILI